MQGYLATIQSREEAVLVGELSPGVGWIGGTDQEQEGVWKWAGGPEKGITFWEGGVKYHVNVLNGWFFLDNVISTIKENYFM